MSTSSVTPENDLKTYRAALIVIGNEILSGRTQDSNTQWIAEKLGPRGVELREVRVVPDEEAIIVSTVNDLRAKYDYVLTTGGIGPTHDDITAESIAKAFGVALEMSAEARQRLLNYYGDESHLTEPRLKMAQIPVGAKLLDNPVSAAPGFVIENVFVMAGVPRIMQAMLDHAMTLMQQGTPYLSNTIACKLGESKIAADLSELQNRYPTVMIGSYPHYRGGALGLSLVLRSLDNARLHRATGELIELIRQNGDEPRAISMMSVEK